MKTIVADPRKWLEDVDVDYAESCIRLVELLAEKNKYFMDGAIDMLREYEVVTLWTDEEDDEYDCTCSSYTNPFCPVHGESESEAEPE